MYSRNYKSRQIAFLKEYLMRLLNMTVKYYYFSVRNLLFWGTVAETRISWRIQWSLCSFVSFNVFFSFFLLFFSIIRFFSHSFLLSLRQYILYTSNIFLIMTEWIWFFFLCQQEGRNALHYAASSGSDGIVKLLLAKKVDATLAAGVSCTRS
jgi:hypothetical protein